MRKILAGILVAVVSVPGGAFAQGVRPDPSHRCAFEGVVRDSVLACAVKEAAHSERVREPSLQSAQGPRRTDGNWARRHPVLLGAVIGAAAGAGYAAATFPEPHNPDVTKGQHMTLLGLAGAGAGALVGYGVSFLLR